MRTLKRVAAILCSATILTGIGTAAFVANAQETVPLQDRESEFDTDVVNIIADQVYAVPGEKVAYSVYLVGNEGTDGYSGSGIVLNYDERLTPAIKEGTEDTPDVQRGIAAEGLLPTYSLNTDLHILGASTAGSMDAICTNDGEYLTTWFTVPADAKDGDTFPITLTVSRWITNKNEPISYYRINGWIKVKDSDTTSSTTTTESTTTTTDTTSSTTSSSSTTDSSSTTTDSTTTTTESTSTTTVSTTTSSTTTTDTTSVTTDSTTGSTSSTTESSTTTTSETTGSTSSKSTDSTTGSTSSTTDSSTTTTSETTASTSSKVTDSVSSDSTTSTTVSVTNTQPPVTGSTTTTTEKTTDHTTAPTTPNANDIAATTKAPGASTGDSGVAVAVTGLVLAAAAAVVSGAKRKEQ
ncbi:MAG: hypothetical protein IJ060_02850 [Oscillospiraceae bacterium]|nr:hypothetical protein [Oscillospiraceae bacterium]